MRQLKIYVVEDDPIIAMTIETALIKQGYKFWGQAETFDEALIGIKKSNPDLVLVDIQLDGNEDGVDLATQLDNLKIPYLYLTSQTDPHTIERVKETHPLGYIVKPFTENGLRSNIEIAWSNYENIEEEYFTFSSNNELHKIKQSQILYLKAFDNYCYVITSDKEYLVPKTLKFLFASLNKEKFYKPHRSYIVNLLKVEGLKTNALSINNIEVPVSNSKKNALKQLLFKN